MAVAYIHQASTGRWHITDDCLDYLDERGTSFPSRRAAIAYMRQTWSLLDAWTHYRAGKKIVPLTTQAERAYVLRKMAEEDASAR